MQNLQLKQVPLTAIGKNGEVGHATISVKNKSPFHGIGHWQHSNQHSTQFQGYGHVVMGILQVYGSCDSDYV